MSNRIRYSKGAEGNYTSVRSFGGFVVELTASTFTIKNAAGEVAASGTGVSMSNLKLKAKKALMGLGVAFDKEARVKKAVV